MAIEWLAVIGAMAGTIATTTAGAAAGKVVGMAAEAVAGTALGEAAGGLIGSLDEGVADVVKAGVGAVAETKVETFNKGVKARMIGRLPLPQNHDLVAGVRRAHLAAVEKVLRFHERAETARPPHERGDASDNPAFAANLWDWLHPRLHGKGPVDHEAVTEADIRRVLDHMVHPSAGEDFAELSARTRAEAERLALAELEAACGAAPSRFVAFFEGRGGEPGWFAMVALYVNEAIKTDERFRSIFLAAELIDLKRLLAAADDRIREINAGLVGLEGRLAGLEGQLRAVADGTGVIDRRTERMERAQEDHGAALAELLALARAGGAFQRAAEQGIPEAALRAIVVRLGGEDIGCDALIPWLDSWIEAARRELGRRTNEDEAFEAARREAARRFREGRLSDASAALMDELRREEAEESERQQERERRRLRLLEEAIRFDELAFDGEAAAEKLRVMAGMEGAAGPNALGQWLHDKAKEFFARGDEKGENGALVVAIAVWRAALEEWTRERAPLNWAITQTNLGVALQTLGGREAGTARLEEAVAAYRAALEEWTRERAPLEWATTQNNLGNALWTLGKREAGTVRLEQAVAAFRAALEEHTRERVPLEWAESVHNQGAVLMHLAERRGDLTLARQALSQIRSAFETFRDAGHVPHAASCEGSLAEAQAVIERLRS